MLQGVASLLAEDLAERPIAENFEVAIFPPLTAIEIVSLVVQSSEIKVGGQDCSAHKYGAYTGEISAEMLYDAGCKYVLVGHSERRQYNHETDELVKQKAERAIENSVIPVICVGENLAQREAGDYLQVITEQVRKSLPYSGSEATSDQVGALLARGLSANYIIAYEPVWAIGTGKTPTLAEINEVHQAIKKLVDKPVLYGGSVKASNAKEIMASDVVDGVLVGGASLNADEFAAMF